MTAIRRLTLANYGMHFADQTALVATPLVAALPLGARAQTIGVLVALQSSAHLLGPIPFGMLADQMQLRTLTVVATLMSAIGFMIAATSIASQTEVLFGLTTLSILPKAIVHAALARANAAIRIPLAICSFAVPLAIGLAVAGVSSATIFVVAFVGAIFAPTHALALPTFEDDPKPTVPVLSRSAEGGRQVRRRALLLAITLCSVFWNLAFAGLLVVLVHVIQEIYRFDPGSFGVALSAFVPAPSQLHGFQGASPKGSGPASSFCLGPEVLASLPPGCCSLTLRDLRSCYTPAFSFRASGRPCGWSRRTRSDNWSRLQRSLDG